MSKKFLLLISFVLVLSLAYTSYGADTVDEMVFTADGDGTVHNYDGRNNLHRCRNAARGVLFRMHQ